MAGADESAEEKDLALPPKKKLVAGSGGGGEEKAAEDARSATPPEACRCWNRARQTRKTAPTARPAASGILRRPPAVPERGRERKREEEKEREVERLKRSFSIDDDDVPFFLRIAKKKTLLPRRTFLVDVHPEQPRPERSGGDHGDQRPGGEEACERNQRGDGDGALDATVGDAGDGRERDERAGEAEQLTVRERALAASEKEEEASDGAGAA